MNRLAGLLAATLFACGGTLAAQEIVLSTYFGSAKADVLAAAAVLPNGSAVIGGTIEATRGGPKGDKLEGGAGTLAVLSKAGKIVAEQKLPRGVNDLDTDADGNIYAAGAFGALKCDATLKKIAWQIELGGAEARIAAGPNGSAVLLAGTQVTVLDAKGKSAGSFAVGGNYLNDVACNPQTGTIFVCGFDNKSGTPPGQKKYPVQVAFVRAYDAAGSQQWAAYGWNGQQVADLHLMADTRAYRLAFGGDGKLYVAGESAGGNTIWSRSSLKLDEKVAMPKGDAFQNAYNTRANHITAVVRLDPRTGESELATLLLARSADGRGNTIRPRAIAADAAGNVYVGGASAASPPKSPGSFGREGGGAFFIIFDPTLKRCYATTLAGDGATQGLGVGHGTVIAVGDTKTALTTHKPLKAEGDDQGDGFLALFRAKL